MLVNLKSLHKAKDIEELFSSVNNTINNITYNSYQLQFDYFCYREMGKRKHLPFAVSDPRIDRRNVVYLYS